VTPSRAPSPRHRQGLQVDLVCASANASSPEDCREALPLGRTGSSVQLVAQVTGPDGNDAGTDRDPAQGISVVFSENGANATVTPDCVTDSAGRCTVTLTETTPVDGEVVAVTATIRGQNPSGDLGEDVTAATGERSSDTARVTWRNTGGLGPLRRPAAGGAVHDRCGQTREVTGDRDGRERRRRAGRAR
jgi:hypothetical protein